MGSFRAASVSWRTGSKAKVNTKNNLLPFVLCNETQSVWIKLALAVKTLQPNCAGYQLSIEEEGRDVHTTQKPLLQGSASIKIQKQRIWAIAHTVVTDYSIETCQCSLVGNHASHPQGSSPSKCASVAIAPWVELIGSEEDPKVKPNQSNALS